MFARSFAKNALRAAILGGTLTLAGACVATTGRLYVRIGPPAPVYEARVISPGPGYIWVEGYQRWDGRGYVWVPGRWARPPQPRAVWVRGRWEHDRRGWYYIEGHWR